MEGNIYDKQVAANYVTSIDVIEANTATKDDVKRRKKFEILRSQEHKRLGIAHSVELRMLDKLS